MAPIAVTTAIRGPHLERLNEGCSSPLTPFNNRDGSIRLNPRTAHQMASKLMTTEPTKPIPRLVAEMCSDKNDATPGVGQRAARIANIAAA